jgi:hypothetical protein
MNEISKTVTAAYSGNIKQEKPFIKGEYIS